MSNNLSSYLADQLIRWIAQNEDMDTAPGILWVALHTGDPGADGSQNEITDSNYSREAVDAPGDLDYDSANSEATLNTEIEFSEFTEEIGDVTHFSVWDGSDDTDNALAMDELDSAREGMGDGDFIRFQAGQLSINGLEWM